MNNSVWVFGDSFSEDISRVPNYPQDKRWEYINLYLNGIPYLCWGEIVANELNYVYKNYAAYNSHTFSLFHNGNSNQVMLNNISYFCSQFKKNDIVFVGFTDPTRFIYPINNEQNNILPNGIPHKIKDNEKKLCENILVHRLENQFYYICELLNNLKFLETLSKIIDFKLYYWSWDSEFEKYITSDYDNNFWIFKQIFNDYSNYFSILSNKTKFSTINLETKGKIKDNHTGKIGNEGHAKLILPYLKQQLNKL